MDPIAFHFGPIAVHWYGILIAIAFLIGILGTGRAVRHAGLNEDDYYTVVIALIFFAIIGARAYYVLFEWDYYSVHPREIVAIWNGGLAIHGGVLSGMLVLFLGAKRYGFSFWQLADIIAPFLILGQAIGRWGNYFNQEAYGYAVNKEDVPWAIDINGTWHHPTFLYESIWDLGGFFLLLWLSRHPRVKGGEIALSYLMYYSVGRFFIEGFRTDSLMLGPLRMAQVMSLCMFIVAVCVFIWRRQKASHAKKDRR